MAGNPKDLTKAEWIQNSKPTDKGTGIYWIRDKSNKYEQIFVPSITRPRFKAVEDEFNVTNWTLEATRWVPDEIESISSLVSSKCEGRCSDDLDCVNNACRCIEKRCRRK